MRYDKTMLNPFFLCVRCLNNYLFKHYKNLVEKERKEFLAYIEEYFKLAREDYEFMNNYILRYVNVSLPIRFYF